jgi:catechol 2,3-dioxygenase-like lactoylglutathione lyase family enzyme
MPRRKGVRGSIGVEGVTPILRVRNLADSLRYYVAVLGFKVDWKGPHMASVSRSGHAIMLCPGDQGHPGTWVWIGVTDVEGLFAEYERKGAVIRHPPTHYPWAYEMQVADPDRHVLRFGSEPQANRSTGEWLDARGRTWALSPAGEWRRSRSKAASAMRARRGR